MLNMTYMKYIQNSMCCFIPGKVLDELERVLNIVEKTSSPPRPNEVLQELRDISSMAMEYFEEKIVPSIRGQTTPTTSQDSPPVTASKTPKIYFVQPALQEEIKKLTKVNKRQTLQISVLIKDIQTLSKRLQKHKYRVKKQAAKIKENTLKIKEQENKSAQQDNTIAEMKKHMAEWEQKLNSLSTEVVNSRDDIVKAIFPVPPEVLQNAPAPVQGHKTVIRPRVAQVQTPNTYIVELERKRKASIDADIPNKLRFIMKHDSNMQSLKEQVQNKINQNITQNIAQNIRKEVEDTSKKKFELSRLFNTSMDAIIKNSIGNINARKRRYTTDINEADLLVNLH